MDGSTSTWPLPTLVCAGAASGAVTSLVLTPIELVKCQMQVPVPAARSDALAPTRPPRRPRPTMIVASIYRRHGWLGFWHGQLGTLIRETGGSAAWFGSYEAILRLFQDVDPAPSTPSTSTIHHQLLAGAMAGMSYNFICFPADTVKSRMQTQALTLARHSRPNFGSVTLTLWREQGLVAFYRGCGITLLRAAPSSALIFTIYESLNARFA